MKNVLKRPLSILLAALMVMSLFVAVPITANAGTPGGSGGGTGPGTGIEIGPVVLYAGFATQPSAIEGLVANGSEQALISAGTTADGATPYYYMTTEDITGEQANSLFNSPSKPGSFSTSIPKGTDAGTYYVWCAIDGGSNYGDLLPYMETNNTQITNKLTVTIAAPTYTVTWKNWNGDVLETDTGVAKGSTPTYNGETPEKAEDADNTYTFSCWSPEVTAVTGDVTYTATFTATAKPKPWTYNITTGGEYTCPSTLSQYTTVSGGTEDNPVVINITGQTSGYPIHLKSGYLKIVGNNNTFIGDRGFVFFSELAPNKPNGEAHLTVTDLTIISNNATNQYIQISSQNYKCQSTFENVTFKNCNINGSGAVVIGSETTHTFKNCTFEDITGYNAGGISVRYGSDVTMEGCTFKNCTRTRPYSTSFLGGGAVWVEEDTKLTLDDCTFEGCTGKCGAVGIENTATLTLKGNTTITGNQDGNLYLPTGATFKISDDFTGTVGVTTQTAPTDSASVTLSSDLADTQAALANKNIVSDNANYAVSYDSNKLFLVVPATHTITWKLDANTEIDTTEVVDGVVPTHAAPSKTADIYYTYTFSGWNDGETTYAPNELPAATADVTYTAQFTSEARTFMVFVKKLTGATINVYDVSGETTVAQLKDILASQVGAPASAQRLIFAGKQLEDAKTLADYNIQKESTIHLVAKTLQNIADEEYNVSKTLNFVDEHNQAINVKYKASLLGVQVRKTVDGGYQYGDGTDALRFIAAVNKDLLNGASDYGFIITNTTSGKSLKKTCKGTTHNTIELGDSDADTTIFTAAVYNIQNLDQDLKVEFYIEKNGDTATAKYTKDNTDQHHITTNYNAVNALVNKQDG